MSAGRPRRRIHSEWRDNDTVVVDMRAVLAEQQSTASDATRRPGRRGVQPPPLTRALARQRLAAHQRDRVLLDKFRRELEASERTRAQLTHECRKLRAVVQKKKRDTQDTLARSRMQGTIDHLRGELERANRALERERANGDEAARTLRARVDESARTIERLQHKIAHLERERERVIERLEDVQMDRAGQAMQIAHLKMLSGE